jgi:hypothetical protein
MRALVRSETRAVFITNYVLALVMLGLWWWSRRSPMPAMVSALCVFLVVIAANAIVDPATLYHGIIIKILFIAVLIAGIRAAAASPRENESTATP